MEVNILKYFKAKRKYGKRCCNADTTLQIPARQRDSSWIKSRIDSVSMWVHCENIN